MAGQAANKTVSEIKGCINSIETNNQVSKGKGSGTEKTKKK